LPDANWLTDNCHSNPAAVNYSKLLASFFRINRGIIISLLIITPIGFLSKFYRGPAHLWVNNSLCGVFYEIFWCLVLALFFRRIRPLMIALLVLIVTCSLEFLQLWHPPLLEWLRASFIGRTILGNSFSWSDFPYYFIGAFIGYIWIRRRSNW
jgi:hypothetical protein